MKTPLQAINDAMFEGGNHTVVFTGDSVMIHYLAEHLNMLCHTCGPQFLYMVFDGRLFVITDLAGASYYQAIGRAFYNGWREQLRRTSGGPEETGEI